MDGGPIAKKAYRYQDWCAMYFALEGFKGDASFERLYCEQEKMDFEIWGTSSFIGFQVKINPATLTAKETNNIFLYYLNKSSTSGKQNKSFSFIFSQNPQKSLGHLFTVIKGGGRGVRYGKKIQRFIDTALQNIPVGDFPIDFHYFKENDIRQKVFALSTEILKDKIGKSEDIKIEFIYNFIARLRDEIDLISCKASSSDRNYSFNEIDLLINNFIITFGLEKKDASGTHIIKIELPRDSLKTMKPRIIIEMDPIEINKKEDGAVQ